MPPPLDCADFDFSLGDEVAFGPCTPQLESSALAQMPPQCLPSPEPCWRDLADQHQKALGDALEANSQVGTPKRSPRSLVLGFMVSPPHILLRQLHGPSVQHPLAPGQWGCPDCPVPTCPWQLQETLTQRQEELATLRESNVQLKELASQARQLAAVLDVSAAPTPGPAASRPGWSLGGNGCAGGTGCRVGQGHGGGGGMWGGVGWDGVLRGGCGWCGGRGGRCVVG